MDDKLDPRLGPEAPGRSGEPNASAWHSHLSTGHLSVLGSVLTIWQLGSTVVGHLCSGHVDSSGSGGSAAQARRKVDNAASPLPRAGYLPKSQSPSQRNLPYHAPLRPAAYPARRRALDLIYNPPESTHPPFPRAGF